LGDLPKLRVCDLRGCIVDHTTNGSRVRIWDDGALVADLVRLEEERGFRIDP
jgi:hypothetical protein